MATQAAPTRPAPPTRCVLVLIMFQTCLTWICFSGTYSMFPAMVMQEQCDKLGIARADCNYKSPRIQEIQAGQEAAIAQWTTITTVTGLLCCALYSHLSDVIGRKPLLIVATVQAILTYGLLAWKGLADPTAYAVLAAMSFMSNIYQVNGVVFASLADACDQWGSSLTEQAALFGQLEAMIWLGQLIGPVAGGMAASSLGPQTAFILPAALSCVQLLILVPFFPETLLKERRSRFNWRELHPLGGLISSCRSSRCRILLLGLLFGQFATSSGIGTWSLYCVKLFGWGFNEVGALMSAYFTANTIGLWILLPVFLKFLTPPRVIIVGASCAALMWGLCAATTAGWQLFLITTLGGATAMMYPIVRSLVSSALFSHGVGLGAVSSIEILCTLGTSASNELFGRLAAHGAGRFTFLMPAVACLMSLAFFVSVKPEGGVSETSARLADSAGAAACDADA
eukprot:gb/GFBE01040852.1/.p1 GENE.gb/GFBE01040852.1/~~gb/GFBE01040852.1/.p1  ORF type:complete len:455 (+),score=62.52 gb/GFBE01040852.1/:1-1365(+)